MAGIVAFGAYIPRLRLERAAAVKQMAWLAPNLAGKAKGVRSMANWDEDALTMAVEACRDVLGDADDRDYVDALYLASTTLPFADRQNATLVAEALTLKENLIAMDIANSQRAGSSALIEGLCRAGSHKQKVLVVASDKRKTRAASPQELDFGDGAAALLLGADDGVAKFLGSHTLNRDFVDHFRGEGEEFDYNWEERWIRDEGLAKLVPAAVKGVLEKTNTAAADIKHFVFPTTISSAYRSITGACGLSAESLVSPLRDEMGEAGTAHALLMLAHTLEKAQAGEKILLVQFGSGCSALLFEATGASPSNKSSGVSGHLSAGVSESNYMKFLVFNGLVEWDKGMRAEQDKKTALTTLYRNRGMILGLVGGRCTKTGTIQFPMSRISVNPQEPAVDTQEPYKFAERRANILSWSADYLSFGISPPNHYGMMVFGEGGRIMLDITDVSVGEVETGMEMRMVFRVKDKDSQRGFTRYFWKAVPVRN